MSKNEKLETLNKFCEFIRSLSQEERECLNAFTDGFFLDDLDAIQRYAQCTAEDDPEPENIAVDFLYDYDPDIKINF